MRSPVMTPTVRIVLSHISPHVRALISACASSIDEYVGRPWPSLELDGVDGDDALAPAIRA